MTAARNALRTVPKTTDLNRSPVARYIQLATLFRNRISSGEWPVSSRIPNVDELAAEFVVARGTMREALGLLEQEGLLERLRAKGTFVRTIKPPAEGMVVSNHEGFDVGDRVRVKLVAADPAKGFIDFQGQGER